MCAKRAPRRAAPLTFRLHSLSVATDVLTGLNADAASVRIAFALTIVQIAIFAAIIATLVAVGLAFVRRLFAVARSSTAARSAFLRMLVFTIGAAALMTSLLVINIVEIALASQDAQAGVAAVVPSAERLLTPFALVQFVTLGMALLFAFVARA
jgi:hypothetical protein